ncbi:hypothetical protein ACFPOE_03290 [Caenimonas terrae]|uniref:EF-hand domain-containing protein n=1 Tax=Caenimonas terrae TaxID=696074 RepID=A0ABW0N799_9BURK
MKRFSRFSFHRRSLALFASLAVGSGLAAAQFTVGPAAPSSPSTKAQPAKGAELFHKLDTDRSGGISRKEAGAAGGSVARNFDALDSNHDGTLSMAEFERAAR